ncbi:hypothetical protein NMG60_11005338 [Bertholletia excelsa]
MSIIPGYGARLGNYYDPFLLELYDPFRDFHYGNGLAQTYPPISGETPGLVDVQIASKETPEAHMYRVELPGMKKEDVKVEVDENRVLKIRGERKEEREEKHSRWHLVERSGHTFMRMFRLPENARADQMRVHMQDGVLTITVPKGEARRSHVRTIAIA